MRKIFTLLIGVLAPVYAFCAIGETFTVKVANDLDMSFTVTSEGTVNTVKTSNGNCIDWNYEGDVIVPEEVTYNKVSYTVTEIGQFSFSSCYMKSLTLPSTIVAIRRYGIYASRYLHSLTIPASVKEIEEFGCSMNPLTSLVVEKGNQNYVSIDNVLFTKDETTLVQYACDLPATSYNIPNTVSIIAADAFNNSNNLVEVVIPESVKEIREQAFYQCYNLGKIKIPASVTAIGEGAFTGHNMALKSFDVDEGNAMCKVVDGVLYSKSSNQTLIAYPVANTAKHYDIESGTVNIYGSAFMHAANLHSVNIPGTVASIGKNAFYGCDNLEKVDIPANVKEIGNQAFDYCYNLTKVYFHSAVPPTTNTRGNIFGGNENIVLYVPYTGIGNYRKNEVLTKVHIDPAIDWHDEHWFFVFSCVEGVDFTKSSGLTAYKVVRNPNYLFPIPSSASFKITTRAGESNSPVMLVQVDKAGAGDCVLLQAEPGQTYELHSDDTAPNIADNLLKGAADEETSVWATDDTKTNFVFNGTDFVSVTGAETVALGTGFLQIPTEDVPEDMTSLSVESLPGVNTGIGKVEADKASSVHYDLRGQRTSPTQKGVHVVDGRKVVVR